MIKIKYLLLILMALVISNAKAELSNFKIGQNLFDEKKYDLAKFKFEQDIVFNPKNENSYLYLSKIYNFKNDDNQEERNLNTVILLNPKNEEAILNLTFLKIRKSNYSESKKLIKTFKKICKNLCEQSSNLQNQLDNILLN